MNARPALFLASWLLALDGRFAGLVETLLPRLLSWSKGTLRAEAFRVLRAQAAEPAKPASPRPEPAPSRATAPVPEELLGPKIAETLGQRDLCLILLEALPAIVLDIHVGPPQSPHHRPATREEWDRCIAAGVALLPWEHVVRLRASLSAGRPGTA